MACEMMRADVIASMVCFLLTNALFYCKQGLLMSYDRLSVDFIETVIPTHFECQLLAAVVNRMHQRLDFLSTDV